MIINILYVRIQILYFNLPQTRRTFVPSKIYQHDNFLIRKKCDQIIQQIPNNIS